MYHKRYVKFTSCFSQSRPFSFNRLAFRFFCWTCVKKISFAIYIVMNVKDLPKQYYDYIIASN